MVYVSAYLIIINTFSIWLEKVLSALIVYSSKELSILIAYCFFFLLLTNQKACCVLIVETAALSNQGNSVTKTCYYLKDIIYSCFLHV